MLTRQRAKLKSTVPSTCQDAECIAVQEPSVQIRALSDLSLLEVFSYLQADDLVQVSQVCRRWGQLSTSRSLWAAIKFTCAPDDQVTGGSKLGFMRMVMTLRRSSTVFRYTHVELDTMYSPRSYKARFTDNGDRLVVCVSSPLMLVVTLRELVKDSVTKLTVPDVRNLYLSECEAYTVWETIASKMKLVDLDIALGRTSHLFTSLFRWQSDQRGSISKLKLRLPGIVSGRKGPLCLPFESLMRVNSPQLRRVFVNAEDQQDLLKWCPCSVTSLEATLLRSLPSRLAKMHFLRHLYLLPSADTRASWATLVKTMKLKCIQRTLLKLNVACIKGSCLSVAKTLLEAASCDKTIAAVAKCSDLRWLTLRGFGRTLDHPEKGVAAMSRLMTGLRFLKTLHIDGAPCALLLDAPDSCGSFVALDVPASLTLLKLDVPHEHRNASSSRCGAGLKPTSLCRLMERNRALHVSLNGATHCAAMAGLPNYVLVLPHLVHEYCQECCSIKKNCSANLAIFVDEVLKK